MRLGDVQVGVPVEEALRGAVAFNHNVGRQNRHRRADKLTSAKPGQKYICPDAPITGAEHTLTVHDVDEETTDFSRYMPSGFVLPTCTTRRLPIQSKPDIAQDEIYMRDCDGGDTARRIETPSADDTNECSSASVGIIGGAD